MKKNRMLQLITNIHRIHHIQFSYGYAFKPLSIGYFKGLGFKRVSKGEYHDCTATGRY